MKKNPSKYRILVVDDNISGLYLTSKNLRLDGFDTIEASTGMEALEKAKLKPDVIILDVKLPDISGFEVCSRIKADTETSSIPVIHLSATYMDSDSKVKGLSTGADAYLTHPVEPKVLSATIDAMLRIRRAETRYHEIALQWKTTFDSIKDGLCLIDPAGKVARCNYAMTKILGAAKEDILGNTLASVNKVFECYDGEYFRNNYQRQLNQVAEEDEMCLQDKWFLVAADAIIDEDGTYQGSVFKMTDISNLKNTQQELNIALDELARSNEELELFAYIASHDLKEPLRVVTSYSQLLERTYHKSFDEKGSMFLHFITDSVRKMQNLINDLLLYSRVKTRQEVFEKLDLNVIVKDVLENLSISVNEAHAVITSDHLPVVKGDQVQISQVFQNLLSNALKFRSDEEPRIHIASAIDKNSCRISISDNGIGIEPEYFEKIFVIFQRLHDKDSYPGTGLGLAICKKIIERHGGRIWVESVMGKGTTFHFTFPLR